MDREPRLIRPLNMMPGTPGRGSAELRLVDGRRLLVLQVIGRLFMGAYDDPFRTLEGELAKYALGATVQALVVDLHAEATSEKMALAHLADGRASAVIGTHTHVPTADASIMPGGTAYISDVGMTGDYDSVIGMDKTVSLQRFRSHVPGARNTPALGEATLCAVFLETDDRTGLARTIEPLRSGGRLAPAMPRDHMNRSGADASDRASRTLMDQRRGRRRAAPAHRDDPAARSRPGPAPRRWSTPALMALLAAITALAPFSLQIFLPALPAIQASFAIAPGIVQLALSLSILANAVANLAYGPLSDRFGRRPVLLVGLAAFIAGSLGCALAPSIELLIIARIVQSIGGAAGMVLARAIVRDLYDRERSASIIAYLTMAMVVAPMLAPTIGAVLLDVASWRAIFFLATGIGVALTWPILVTLAETAPAGSGVGAADCSPAPAPCSAPARSGPTCCRARSASPCSSRSSPARRTS